MRRGGRQWRKLRAAWTVTIADNAAAGRPVICRRCDAPILPDQRWQLGHPDAMPVATHGDHTHDLAPEHADENEAAGARLAAQLRRRTTTPTSPRWTPDFSARPASSETLRVSDLSLPSSSDSGGGRGRVVRVGSGSDRVGDASVGAGVGGSGRFSGDRGGVGGEGGSFGGSGGDRGRRARVSGGVGSARASVGASGRWAR